MMPVQKPGAALDALVALAFGWKHVAADRGCDPKNAAGMVTRIPSYSRDSHWEKEMFVWLLSRSRKGVGVYVTVQSSWVYVHSATRGETGETLSHALALLVDAVHEKKIDLSSDDVSRLETDPKPGSSSTP